MSKKRIEGEVDELSEELLGDLDPDERLQLWLEGAAAGNEQWLARLRETASVGTYRATDRAFVGRGKAALQFLNGTVYRLHVAALRYELLEQRQYLQWLLDIERDTDPSDAELEQAGERADQIKDVFLDLYTCYHANRQFATEVLGVPFETWCELHSEGPVVLDIVEEILDNPMRYDLAEEWLNSYHDMEGNESADGDGERDREWITLDEVAEQRYQGLVALWEKALAEIP